MSARRLLLVEPPFYRLFDDAYSLCRYPLGLAHLAAAAAEATGWRVRAYNADFAGQGRSLSVTHLAGEGHRRYLALLADPAAALWREVEAVLADQAPAVLGLSIKSACLASARRVAALAKGLDPRTLVVAGGPHPSAAPGLVLADPNFDLCVAGEGERTLVELLRCLLEGGDPGRVPGVASRDRGGIRFAAPRPLLADLDRLPRPLDRAPELLLEHHRYPAKALGHLMATRGCPQRCSYCASHLIWGRRPRFRAPRAVAAELTLMGRAGIGRAHFDDDTFGVESGYLRRLCGAIAQDCPGLAWSCETHVRLATEANLAAMRKAGCHTVQLGVESGDDRVLRAVGKGFTVAGALEACRLVRAGGLRLEVFLMAGFPQETEESLGRTLALARDLDCDKLIFSLFTPHPGTEAHRLCLSRGLLATDHDFSAHHHQSPANHFCPEIAPARFRELAGEIERLAQERREAAG